MQTTRLHGTDQSTRSMQRYSPLPLICFAARPLWQLTGNLIGVRATLSLSMLFYCGFTAGFCYCRPAFGLPHKTVMFSGPLCKWRLSIGVIDTVSCLSPPGGVISLQTTGSVVSHRVCSPTAPVQVFACCGQIRPACFLLCLLCVFCCYKSAPLAMLVKQLPANVRSASPGAGNADARV